LKEKNNNNKLDDRDLKLLKMEVKEIPECKPPNDKIIHFTLEDNYNGNK